MQIAVMAWVAALCGVMAAPAAAAEVMSTYTDINLDECLVMQSDDFGTTWACPGYKGMPTYVAERSLRFHVSFGFGADQEPAAKQTLEPHNTLGPEIEWRLTNAGGKWRPFAAILRYFVDGDGGEGQVLVVTRIGPGTTCQIAYVDALANENAEELAQQAADEMAAGFDCADAPEVIGDFAAWER